MNERGRERIRWIGRIGAVALAAATLAAAGAAADGGVQGTSSGRSTPAAHGGGHSGGRSGGHGAYYGGRYGGHHRPYTYGGYYGGWGPYWNGWWDPYYYYGPRWGVGWGYTAVYPQPGGRYGALDLDISPERAEVWVDGKRIGVADEYDGFPTYLWLEEGTYDVVFHLPGFRTLARQYSIYAGLVIDVEDRLEEGETVHPTALGPASTERRDARLQRDRELREEVARRQASESPAGDDWLDARDEPGRLRLRISPADASVYLDGRFLGTGDDLARLRSGLLVDPGEHRLEIVRPGYLSIERVVAVARDEEFEIELALEPESGTGD